MTSLRLRVLFGNLIMSCTETDSGSYKNAISFLILRQAIYPVYIGIKTLVKQLGALVLSQTLLVHLARSGLTVGIVDF